MDQTDWENWMRERKAKKVGRLIDQGVLTPEEQKPEWLRGVKGAGEPATARWVPADKDGNPLKE